MTNRFLLSHKPVSALKFWGTFGGNAMQVFMQIRLCNEKLNKISCCNLKFMW